MIIKKILTIFSLIIMATILHAFAANVHLSLYFAMKDVKLNLLGLGGKLSVKQIYSVNRFIDGTRGARHRHDGSHNPITVMEHFASQGYHKQAVINMVIIHNIADMAHEGTDGVNGWKCSPERRKAALKMLEKIKKGEGIPFEKLPKWVRKVGYEIIRKAVQFSKKFTSVIDGGAKKYGKYMSKSAVAIAYAFEVYNFLDEMDPDIMSQKEVVEAKVRLEKISRIFEHNDSAEITNIDLAYIAFLLGKACVDRYKEMIDGFYSGFSCIVFDYCQQIPVTAVKLLELSCRYYPSKITFLYLSVAQFYTKDYAQSLLSISKAKSLCDSDKDKDMFVKIELAQEKLRRIKREDYK